MLLSEFNKIFNNIEGSRRMYDQYITDEISTEEKFDEVVNRAGILHWMTYRLKHISHDAEFYRQHVHSKTYPLKPNDYIYNLVKEGYLEYGNPLEVLTYQNKDALFLFYNNKIEQKETKLNLEKGKQLKKQYINYSNSEKVDLIIESYSRDELRELLGLKGYSKARLVEEVYTRLGYTYFYKKFGHIINNNLLFNEYIDSKTLLKDKPKPIKVKKMLKKSANKDVIIEHLIKEYDNKEFYEYFKETLPVVLTEKGKTSMVDGYFYEIINPYDRDITVSDIFYYNFYGFNEIYEKEVKSRYRKFKQDTNLSEKSFSKLDNINKLEIINFYRNLEEYNESSKYSAFMANYLHDNQNNILSHYFFAIAISDHFNLMLHHREFSNKIKETAKVINQNKDKFEIELLKNITNSFYLDWYYETTIINEMLLGYILESINNLHTSKDIVSNEFKNKVKGNELVYNKINYKLIDNAHLKTINLEVKDIF